MRYFVSALFLLGCASSALAAEVTLKASEDEVVAAARRLSSEDCTPPKDGAGLPIAGCKYGASFVHGQWNVLVQILYVGQDGGAGFSPGGDFLYLFQADGTFLERSRGM